jgi:hypothetical protein
MIGDYFFDNLTKSITTFAAAGISWNPNQILNYELVGNE